MTDTAPACPWWCTDHRSGATVDDDQHARLLAAPAGSWVAILAGTGPRDRAELGYAIEGYDADPGRARAFARALLAAAEIFDRIAP